MKRTAVALLALAALACAGADAQQPRLIDFNPWSWIPTNRNKSPSIMDYFFPPSRTPKQSNLDPPADRQPPTTIDDQTMTTIDERPTTSGRKSHNKNKATIPTAKLTTTTQPKTKKSSHKHIATDTTVETKTTPPVKTETTQTTNIVTTTTAKPPKRYTIRTVRTTETPPVQETESTVNANSDITETVSGVETTATTDVVKDTAPVVTTTVDRSTEATSTGTESTTLIDSTAEPVDSREGYLPLRDKPQQNHVKINEQTNKEGLGCLPYEHSIVLRKDAVPCIDPPRKVPFALVEPLRKELELMEELGIIQKVHEPTLWTVPLPAGSTSVLAKPTKYHYYPHNQHIYLLPECAIQQVCNAVYVRLNYTQPLCACPSRYRDPCSASLNADDLHTTRLTTDSKKKYAKKAVTLVKTCEPVAEMRECRAPRDWSLLALQNIRTGKSHYLVICRCPESHILEGPMSHDTPTYASVPGIRVYGMVCVRSTGYNGFNTNRFSGAVQSTTSSYKVDYSQPHAYGDKPIYNRYQTHSYLDNNYYNRRSRVSRVRRMTSPNPPFPWHKVKELARSLHWIN